MTDRAEYGLVTPVDLARMSEQVAQRLHDFLPFTPFVRFATLSDRVGAEVLVKCEHLQRTGSFKARGSLAKLLSLTDEQRDRGVVAASSGNHGLGVAHALDLLGGRGIVFVPENVASVKVDAIRRFGVEIRSHGTDSGAVEIMARQFATDEGLTYISPYNDVDVIAGQGTVGVEIAEQLAGAGLDAIFVAVGGGGLISGIAAVLRQHLPNIRVYGAAPANDAAMVASVRAGQVVGVEARPTLSDGTAGSVEPGAITLRLCQSLVDEWVLVSEDEIRDALRFVIDTEHQLIEGAAAAAFAAAIGRSAELAGQRVAVVSCGANISARTLATALIE
ncbi:MAG TPA: threonine/serine dehydratase [Pseudonocardiaceae bacterium]|nr:threonine/serine dehydratase [Pseudonocardiaceae bacterium]